ncbi:hypothetical protein KAR28_00575 [Candidatus Parcubacteria bacterium]|nr:hypothetical protein [Candidatus Parcubacteria bacterium]
MAKGKGNNKKKKRPKNNSSYKCSRGIIPGSTACLSLLAKVNSRCKHCCEPKVIKKVKQIYR